MKDKVKGIIKKIQLCTIKLWDRTVRESFFKVAAIESTLISTITIFFPIKDEYQKRLFISFILFLVLSYVGVWIYSNGKKSVSFRIGKTKVLIKQGDIFEEDGLKVIAANEYFDTRVGDNLIDPKSLYGIYLRQYCKNSIADLDQAMIDNLSSSTLLTDEMREKGKKIQYRLGTVFNDQKGFLLVAYAKFDDNNRAFLSPNDAMSCYMNMWNEIDKYRGNESICLPVLGSGGLVRNLFSRYSSQQLIELILGTFRASGITLSRNAMLKIIVFGDMADEINFLKLRNYSD